MAEMTVQDLAALQDLTKERHSDTWSKNLPVWAIVVFLIIIAWFWYVHRTGQDKADLAAAVQSTVSRVNALEIATTNQGNNLTSINSVLSATTQAVGDFKSVANQQLAALDAAVFVPRCSGNGGCNGNGSARFVKRANYCLEDSSLQEIDTCG